jgi:hypothetical protein
MVDAISYAILAAIVVSGAYFIGTLLRDDAAEDVSHDFADDPHPASLLTSVFPPHDLRM